MKPLPLLVVLIALAAAACGDAEEEGLPDGGNDLAASTTAAVTGTPPVTVSPAPTATPAAETAAPTPVATRWEDYIDAERGFSFPYPPGLSMSVDYFDVGGKAGGGGVQRRTISFLRSDGVTAFGVGVEPNPGNLSAEQWAKEDGWPSEPGQVTIDGQIGLLFPINEMGDKYPVVIVAHDDVVFIIGGNVFGVPGAGYPAGISETDFQRVLEGFKFGN